MHFIRADLPETVIEVHRFRTFRCAVPIEDQRSWSSDTESSIRCICSGEREISERVLSNLSSNVRSSMVVFMRAATTSTTTGADPDVAAMSITDSMISVDHSLSHLPAKTALELVEFCRRRLDASEARILADRYEKGASDRDVEDMAKGSDGKTSKAAAKKKARRAKAANANPGLADRLAEGDLSSEQVDVIADAADETDGEAACDEELIDTVAGTSPEQGKKKARELSLIHI